MLSAQGSHKGQFVNSVLARNHVACGVACICWRRQEEDGFITFLKKKVSCYHSCCATIRATMCIYLIYQDNNCAWRSVPSNCLLSLTTINLQYFFSNTFSRTFLEHKLIVAPHGNSRSCEPYMRTMLTKVRLKKNTALQFVSTFGNTVCLCLPPGYTFIRLNPAEEKLVLIRFTTQKYMHTPHYLLNRFGTELF